MKRLLLTLPLLLGVSCAKFPGDGSSGNQYPLVSFTVRMQGEVNDTADGDPSTSYRYFVAIRALKTDDLPPTGSPLPVTSTDVNQGGSPNGFVSGSPTHFVEYVSNQPTQSYPYRLHRFNPGPTQGEPDNPINLGSAPDTLNEPGIGPILLFTRPHDSGANPNELKFSLYLNQLATDQIAVADIRKLEINILTMNVTASQAGSRAYDSLGDGRSGSTDANQTILVDVRSNQIFDNRYSIEPTGDVAGAGNDPSLDIEDFSVEVRQP